MKLLLDENLSDRLVDLLSDLFPGSLHVKHVGLAEAEDREVWTYARERGFVLMSKDKDFQQLSALHGAPSKLVWLRIGNTSTSHVAEQIRANAAELVSFVRDDKKSLLILAAAST